MRQLSDFLEVMGADELRTIVEGLELDCRDRRQRVLLIAAITEGVDDPVSLLSAMPVADLRWYAEYFGIPATGKKADLIARLLEDPVDEGDLEDPDVELEIATSAHSQEATAVLLQLAVKPADPVPHRTVEPDPANDAIAEAPADLAGFTAWLEGAVASRAVAQQATNYFYCRACSKKHAVRWLNYIGQEKSFYICRIGRTQIVESEGKGRNFEVFNPDEYVAANPIAGAVAAEISRLEALEEQGRRSLVARLFRGSKDAGLHMVQSVRLGAISTTPPFIELRVEQEDARESPPIHAQRRIVRNFVLRRMFEALREAGPLQR